MKLEVGMYVRTNRGNIFKVENAVEIDADGTWFKSKVKEKSVIKDLPGFMYDEEDEIINKASHNIIDLVRENDFVNGEKVGYIDNCEGALREYYYDYEDANVDAGHWFEEIKSIVTKEQFESMSYKVGE